MKYIGKTLFQQKNKSSKERKVKAKKFDLQTLLGGSFNNYSTIFD